MEFLHTDVERSTLLTFHHGAIRRPRKLEWSDGKTFAFHLHWPPRVRIRLPCWKETPDSRAIHYENLRGFSSRVCESLHLRHPQKLLPVVGSVLGNARPIFHH